jgi:uncharacterized protein (DUF608 family)
LGGIGTGTVSLGARGELRDWELQNKPAKGRRNPFSFFAIRAQREGSAPVAKVLEAGLTLGRDQQHGVWYGQMGGIPRMAAATLIGEYPIARVDFADESLPVAVALTAFTPMIPLNSLDSGIPAAVLRYTISNVSDAPVAVTVVGSLSHLAGVGTSMFDFGAPTQSVAWRDHEGIRGLDFGVDLDSRDPRYGTMSLMTTAERVTVKRSWVPSFVGVGSELFWRDFVTDGLLDSDDVLPADDEVLGGPPPSRCTGSLGIVADLLPGETRDMEFVLAWSFPNRANFWDESPSVRAAPGQPETVGNYYATQWADSWAAGRYLLENLPRLEGETRAFRDALFATDLDPAILDALSCTASVVRSTTCFRIADGTFLAWEGSDDSSGSCFGTCTHVWSYAQTVAWLFPDLERSARRYEFLLEIDDSGMHAPRSRRIFGFPPTPEAEIPPAVDGQMGSILRLHREWRFSGDDGFLRELWPGAVRSIEYALREWDSDGDGVLDQRVFNTYDIFFYGAEPLGNVMLLGALRAMSAMALHLGETETADRYRTAADRTAGAVESLLWNGEYYEQKLVDVEAHRYQYGTAVLSDQMLGQLHAHLGGLGYLLPEEHVKSAMGAIYTHNFRASLAEHQSIQRAYAMPDEGGLLTASWPRGGRPTVPFIYSDEVWTGIEYQVAAGLIFEGRLDDATRIVRTARARHTGQYRSPWDDIEAGHHYARSMSAWAILIAASGVQYDGPSGTLAFDPVLDGTYFFSTGTAWGLATIADAHLVLDVRWGTLDLASVRVRDRTFPGRQLTAGQTARF